MSKKLLLALFAVAFLFIVAGCQETADKSGKGIVHIGVEEEVITKQTGLLKEPPASSIHRTA